MRQSAPDVQVISNLTTTALAMGIDAEGAGYLMSLLSNMYSDPSLALVREYASNARDSHIEAGNPDPILVTSPTHFEPKLTVQDFGVGLSRTQVEEVYATYLKSTKRDSDDQIGHFGIGAKSAFAVASSFVVTAVKRGLQTVALFSLNEEGTPTVNVASHTATFEPDGVKVEVAVSDIGAVQRAIEKLFATWPQGSVLVDGVEPACVWDSLHKITDDVHLGWRPNAWEDQDKAWTVVMGGVPYTLPRAVINALELRQRNIVQSVASSNAKIYLSVPIGGVDITPSREDLMVTPKTIATVNALVEDFHLHLPAWITAQISDSPTRISAIIAHSKLRSRLHRHLAVSGATWQGRPIPPNPIQTEAEWFQLKRRGYMGEANARREHRFQVHPDELLEHVLFVTGVPENRIRTVQLAAKAYLKQWGKDDEDKITRVVAITPSFTPAKDWFDLRDPALKTMSFDKFKDFKPAPVKGQSRSGATRYNIRIDGGHGDMNAGDLIATGDKVYYLTRDEAIRYPEQGTLTKEIVGSDILVLLKPTQSASVLIKRVPGVINAAEEVEKLAQKIIDGVTQNDVDALDAHNYLTQVPRQIAELLTRERAKITNPAVLDALGEYDRATCLRNSRDTSRVELARRFTGKSYADLGRSTFDHAQWGKLLDGLPLLARYFERSWGQTTKGDEHCIAYVNMAAVL